MSTIVRVSAVALALTSSVNALTLKTLMENQIGADLELESEL